MKTPQHPKLYPYLLIRYSGGHFRAFDHFAIEDMNVLLHRLEALEQAAAALRQPVCDALFEWIKTAPAGAELRTFIQLKRDIYNQRPLNGRQLQAVSSLPPALGNDIRRLQQLLEERDAFYRHFLAAYQQQLEQGAKALITLAGDERFRKALLLSSSVLSAKLSENGEMINGTALNGREKRFFYSLLRYLSRMYFKTSPFSYFTPVGCVRAVSGLPAIFDPPAFPFAVHSHTRPNNFLYHLLTGMIGAHPETAAHLPLRANPMLRISGEQVEFMFLSEQSEYFQRIKRNAVIDRVLELLRPGSTIDKLAQQLSVDMEDTAPSRIATYLQGLVKAGLMQYDFRTRALSPDWPQQLSALLSTMPSHPVLDATVTFLQELAATAAGYRESALPARRQLLDKSRKSLQQTVALYNEGQKQLPEQVIYEDTFTAQPGKIDREQTAALAGLAEELCQRLSALDALEPERARMRQLFIRLYGEAAEADLLDFYKQFREQYTDRKDEQAADDDFALLHRKQYRALVERLKALFEAKGLSATHDLDLTQDDLQQVETGPGKHIFSRGMFAQPFIKEIDGQPCLHLVVNSIFQGMGKTIGRFLHLIDEEATEYLRQANRESVAPGLAFELTDASTFNANIHPPLLPYVLAQPGAHHSYPEEQQINVQDIRVRYLPEEQRLMLFHAATGKTLVPFDLALQAINRRSGLYRFLVHFSSDEAISFRPLAIALDEYLKEKNNWDEGCIHLLPQISYRRRLIIRRRAWLVPVSLVPGRKAGEDDAAYFLQLNRWFRSQNIPRRIFLKLQPRKAGAVNGDEYKPQYLDTYAPYFILLFERLLEKAGKHIYLEEMLPGIAQIEPNGVNELLIQWHN